MSEHVPFYGERSGNVMEVDVQRVTDGLGYGDGGISAAELRDKLSAEVYDELDQRLDAVVASGEVLVPVEADDDGCGDGRGVLTVFNKDQEFSRSLHRAKVFGAAPAMSTATRIGLGKTKGVPLQRVFQGGIDKLKDRMVNFGGHTDEHADEHGPNCGCGAIDKAPQAIEHAVRFEDKIYETIEALGVSTEGLDEVQASYRAYAAEIADDESYQGAKVMDEIIDSGKIVKKLKGSHIEARILLNMVPGYTVDQGAIRRATEGRIDVFAVDVWRMQQLAEQLYDDPAEQQKAFLSELVYTLGVAATLTKGDLPVDVISSANALTPAGV